MDPRTAVEHVHLLFARHLCSGPDRGEHREVEDVSRLAVRDQLPAATTRALDLTFDDYTSQVVAYLDPAEAEGFGSRASWDALQTQVVEALERARASA